MTMTDHPIASCRSSAVRSAMLVGEPSGSIYRLGASTMKIGTAGMLGGYKVLESDLVTGPRSLRVRMSDQGASTAGLVAAAYALATRAERTREHARAPCGVAGQ